MKPKQVGYLKGNDYPKGEISETVFDRLAMLCKNPAIRWFGFHQCDLDPCDKQEQPDLFWRGLVIPKSATVDILVVGKTNSYLAPSLILHYIRQHKYLPPSEFIEAVETCAEQDSADYIEALRSIWALKPR
jgi:hypothetical protein